MTRFDLDFRRIFGSGDNDMKTSIKRDSELEFVALVGTAPNDLKGRKTMPSKRLDDPDFVYRPALETDIRETWNRARTL